jgi:hypothetical protein
MYMNGSNISLNINQTPAPTHQVQLIGGNPPRTASNSNSLNFVFCASDFGEPSRRPYVAARPPT